ncbi:MAG TPA: serine/threonine-protein kinase, partial [Kofleriaceae bacterium]|nr:serine/threonine-protein kinase [Kofleriaceae bacterium]
MSAGETAPEPDRLLGRSLGEFRLLEIIGTGASGVVYRAEQPLLEREAAVKVLLADGDDAITAFLAEARLASGLDHPYAAHIYGFGVESDHVMWCAMELVRGTTLAQWIQDRGPMAAERFLPLLERICEVVQTAHDKGIVHRDLKPANVMVLSRAGRLLPKLLDFGIARGARDEVKRKGIVGSPAFMAPEQWIDARRVDPRTDQYALGVLCFQVLTGVLPFRDGTLLQIAGQHARSPVPALGDGVPAALHPVIARAMGKTRDERFANLMQLASAFRAALDLPAEAEALPQLDEALRDALVLGAPQPIAESIAALETARDVEHAWKAAELVHAVAAQYVALLALSGWLHVAAARRPHSELLANRLGELGSAGLDAVGWLDIACEIARGFHADPTAFPLPELVIALGDPAFPRPQVQRVDLPRYFVELDRMLRKLAWLSDYRTGAVAKRALHVWTGTRRVQRVIAHAAKGAPDGSVVVIDADHNAVLTLSPLVQVARPSPGMAEELFLLDGADKRGLRLRAHPLGFDHRDPDLANTLREAGLVLGASTTAGDEAEQAPYRGLATFTADDASWFFGREREIEAFVNRLRVTSLLAVVGPSGAGKSSFVQAGVLPSLPAETRSLTVRPGANPIGELAARLARAGIDIDRERILAEPAALATAIAAKHAAFVLVVDQFEELFTLGVAAAEQRAYSEALAAAGNGDHEGLRVILTLRDDFLVRSEQLPALRQRLATGLELLSTPAADDLARVLVEPAQRVGYHFEDDELVQEMVRAVAEQPGALPLLSFTASRLWELRDVRFRALVRRAYQSLGGVGGALAKHADETLAKLPLDQQPLVREIFRHLVTSAGTRAVLSRREATQLLGGGGRAEAVLEQLVGSRLVVSSEGEGGHDRVEVAHEALIAAWPRLVAWRREDAEIVRVRDQLRATARQWGERDRPRGLLWRDDVLAEYRLWRTRYTGALTEIEDEFGRRSIELADRAQRRRRMLLSLAFVVLSAGAIALAVLGTRASHNADTANRLLVDSYFEQARTALLAGRQAEALDYIRLARAAGLDTPSLRLMNAYAKPSVGSEVARLDGHGGRAWDLAYSPDGTRIYSAHADGSIRVWAADDHRLVATWKGHAGAIQRIELARDGKLLATTGDDGVTIVWDTATGHAIGRHAGPAGRSYCLAFDEQAGVIATASDHHLWIGEPTTGRTWQQPSYEDLAYACAIDPLGRWVVTADAVAGTASVWDVKTGERRLVLAHGGLVSDVALSHDGAILATASWDGNVRIWSLPDGKLLHVMAGHGDKVDGVDLSPDDKRLISVGRDLIVRVWDAATGDALYTLRGHRDRIYRARFDARGHELITTSQDGTARLWDLDHGRLVKIVDGSSAEPLVGARFSPDGSTFAVASWDGTIALWNTDDPFHVETWPGDAHPCEGDNRPA